MKIGKILLPIDFSEGSAAAERAAVDLAQQLGAQVTPLHVYQLPAFSMPNGVWYAPTPELVGDVIRGARASLKEAAIRLERAGARVGDPIAVEGVPYEEIVRAADSGGYDMVVIGTHGRTGVSRLLLGSVAEKVARLCRRPVLIVRAEASPDAPKQTSR